MCGFCFAVGEKKKLVCFASGDFIKCFCVDFALRCVIWGWFPLVSQSTIFPFENSNETVAILLCLRTKQASKQLEKGEKIPSDYKNWRKISAVAWQPRDGNAQPRSTGVLRLWCWASTSARGTTMHRCASILRGYLASDITRRPLQWVPRFKSAP